MTIKILGDLNLEMALLWEKGCVYRHFLTQTKCFEMSKTPKGVFNDHTLGKTNGQDLTNFISVLFYTSII